MNICSRIKIVIGGDPLQIWFEIEFYFVFEVLYSFEKYFEKENKISIFLDNNKDFLRTF